MTRRLEATLSTPRGPFVIAHRCGNSLLAMRTAEAHGVRVIEADVHLFRRRLEVRHLKTLGPVPLLWDRWRLASPFGPRLVLAELLAASDPKTELLLDLKGRHRELADQVLQLVRPRLEAGGLVTISARKWPLLEPFCGVEGVRGLHSVGTKRQLRRLRSESAGTRLDGISIHERLLDSRTMRELRDLTDMIITWPVNTHDRARELLAWGVSGLITDRPDHLLPLAIPEAS